MGPGESARNPVINIQKFYLANPGAPNITLSLPSTLCKSKSCCFLVGRVLSSFDLGNMDGAIPGGGKEESIDDLLTKVR